MTYTLMGRGESHRREVSSHQYSGFLVPNTCSGWISTVPVLITETALIGSAVLPCACAVVTELGMASP